MKQNSTGINGGNSSDALKVTLVFTAGGQEQSYSHNILLPHTPDPNLIPLAAAETFGEIEKEIHFSDFYEQLPDPLFLQKNAPRTYRPTEWLGEERMFHMNSQQVWHEITNTLLSAKYSLAQARAYKDVELSIIEEGVDHRSPVVMNVHLSKMNAFDGAVYRLAKIEDLFLLLLFVNLGNSLVETNLKSDDWQKKIFWNAVKDGLRKRHPEAVSNRYLNQLPDAEYSSIVSVFNKFKNLTEVSELVGYRDATTHRIPPSVDYHGLSAVLILPKGQQTSSTIQAENFVRKYKVDYQFLDLYGKATKVFSHYVQVLQELKAVPRFA